MCWRGDIDPGGGDVEIGEGMWTAKGGSLVLAEEGSLGDVDAEEMGRVKSLVAVGLWCLAHDSLFCTTRLY